MIISLVGNGDLAFIYFLSFLRVIWQGLQIARKFVQFPDRITHNNLLSKSESCGLDGWTEQWIRDWLDDGMKVSSQRLNVQMETGVRWRPSKICLETGAVQYLHQ